MAGHRSTRLPIVKALCAQHQTEGSSHPGSSHLHAWWMGKIYSITAHKMSHKGQDHPHEIKKKMILSQLGFSLLWWNSKSKSKSGRKGLYLACTSTSWSIITEGSQERNSSQARNLEVETEQNHGGCSPWHAQPAFSENPDWPAQWSAHAPMNH